MESDEAAYLRRTPGDARGGQFFFSAPGQGKASRPLQPNNPSEASALSTENA